MKREPITDIGYEKLIKDLQFLKEIEIPDNIKDIKISASYGDLTKNAGLNGKWDTGNTGE